ncbi:MAG: methyl-accepting chemotaxis protein [Treponemataceae bacterium]|nr:methyl-accepting chemotaxis protein [Treponemataceae bacterium]
MESSSYVANKFAPPKEIYDELPMQIQKRIPYIIGGNVVCIAGMFLFSIVLGIMRQYLIGTLGAVSIVLFILSVSLIKKGKVILGANFSTFGFIVACEIMIFFSPYFNTGLVVYRNAFFLMVMAVLNMLISISRRQLVLFYSIVLVSWLISPFASLRPLFENKFASAVSNMALATLGIVVINTIIMFYNRYNHRLIEVAEAKQKEAVAALDTITKAIDNTKDSLNIGQQLNNSVDEATSSVKEITRLYQALIVQTNRLTDESKAVQVSGKQVTREAAEMKASVSEQNASITETSAAMTQIAANLSNINQIAEKRKTGMDGILKTLDSQTKLLSTLVGQVQRVKESSDKIAQFVNTVDSIASQTGLLAMNASIEAAHAGNLGKGFSVIAQEIRKLSEETTRNADKISETLQENTLVVQETSSSVSSFATYTQNSTEEIRTTIGAIEEILSGIGEMTIGTGEVMKALQNIVKESRASACMVENVVDEVGAQNTSLDEIANSSQDIQMQFASLDDSLNHIKHAMNEIKKQAETNADVSAKIISSLQ